MSLFPNWESSPSHCYRSNAITAFQPIQAHSGFVKPFFEMLKITTNFTVDEAG